MQERERRFDELARAVAQPLRRYVVRRTDPDTAEDVLADALLVLWRRLDDVPADAALPWCYGVARRCLANAERAARRRGRLAERAAGIHGPQPAQGHEEDPRIEEVHTALARLGEEDRELLRLWAWEELSPAEIAMVLGVTPNAVSIRLHRARKKVASLLATGAGERPGPVPDRNR